MAMQSEAMQSFPGSETSKRAQEPGPLLFRNLTWSASPNVEAESVTVSVAVPPVDLPAIVEAAREEGRREIAAVLEDDLQRRVRAERDNVTLALESFASEKRNYFAGLEKEVVRLALAIAERVIHRESAMDPTLLAGAARVVLDQVNRDSTATMLVATGEASQWRVATAALGRDINLVEENSLERGTCLLKTEAASFELGLRSQLCEIERGFFELLGRGSAVAA